MAFFLEDVLVSTSPYMLIHSPKLDSLVHVGQLSGPFTAAFQSMRSKRKERDGC